MFLLGDKVMTKFSPVYAVTSGKDAPAAIISEKPQKSAIDTVQTIGIRKRIVRARQLTRSKRKLGNPITG